MVRTWGSPPGTHPFEFDHRVVDGDVEARGHAVGGRYLVQDQHPALDGLPAQGGIVHQARSPLIRPSAVLWTATNVPRPRWR